jgi:hypothetical protein
MRTVGILIGVILLVLICSAPAHAQLSGGALSNSSLTGPMFRTLPSIPPAEFRVITVSGSESTFLPSSFLPYDQAVALGAANPSRAVFMNFDDAVRKGIDDAVRKGAADASPLFMTYDDAVRKGFAEVTAKEKSPAEAARAYRRARQRSAATQPKAN